jgi:hypothetical protein
MQPPPRAFIAVMEIALWNFRESWLSKVSFKWAGSTGMGIYRKGRE